VFAGINVPYRVDSSLQIAAKTGYGFSDQRLKWSVEPEYSIRNGITLKGSLYRKIGTFPVNYSGPLPWNSVSAFFNGQDYYQYYERAGGEFSFQHKMGRFGTFSAGFVKERQLSLAKNTDFSIAFIGTAKKFSPNMPVREGVLQSFLFEIQGGGEDRRSFFFL
jgi:hypothetical protein